VEIIRRKILSTAFQHVINRLVNIQHDKVRLKNLQQRRMIFDRRPEIFSFGISDPISPATMDSSKTG